MAEQSFHSLQDLFTHGLMDIYDAEQQITQALPKMVEAAASPKLKEKFRKHLDETKQQITRLERVFGLMNMQPRGIHCVGMAGLIQEGQEIMEAPGDPAVKDAGLIASAQKVEHYEIASYGTLRTWAQTMGRDDVATQLQTTLKQESSTDEMLSHLAESGLNRKAA